MRNYFYNSIGEINVDFFERYIYDRLVCEYGKNFNIYFTCGIPRRMFFKLENLQILNNKIEDFDFFVLDKELNILYFSTQNIANKFIMKKLNISLCDHSHLIKKINNKFYYLTLWSYDDCIYDYKNDVLLNTESV
ncbi:MAG: hypothetical protein ACOCWG_06465, partial [bacterium]